MCQTCAQAKKLSQPPKSPPVIGGFTNVVHLVVLKFSSELWFKLEPDQTEPFFGVQVQHFSELDHWSGSQFSQSDIWLSTFKLCLCLLISDLSALSSSEWT